MLGINTYGLVNHLSKHLLAIDAFGCGGSARGQNGSEPRISVSARKEPGYLWRREDGGGGKECQED
jgi:hypothetical protein